MIKRLLLACLSSVGVFACSEPWAPPDGDLVFHPESTLRMLGDADAVVPSPPSVRLYYLGSNKPAAKVPVTFTLENPDGGRTSLLVLTDESGRAALATWRLGSQAGAYTVTASVEGEPPIVFTTFVPGKVAAIYDLVMIGGIPIAEYAGYLTESHYVLFEGGLYLRAFEPVNDDPYLLPGIQNYVRTGSDRIDFYTDSSPMGIQGYGFHVARGALAGNTMSVSYDDFFDELDEVYVLRAR